MTKLARFCGRGPSGHVVERRAATLRSHDPIRVSTTSRALAVIRCLRSGAHAQRVDIDLDLNLAATATGIALVADSPVDLLAISPGICGMTTAQANQLAGLPNQWERWSSRSC